MHVHNAKQMHSPPPTTPPVMAPTLTMKWTGEEYKYTWQDNVVNKNYTLGRHNNIITILPLHATKTSVIVGEYLVQDGGRGGGIYIIIIVIY